MRWCAWSVVTLWVMACGSSGADRTPAPADSSAASAAVTARGDSGLAPMMLWPDSLGGFLAVANGSTGAALLFRRDTSVAVDGIGVVGFDSVATPAVLRDVRPVPCAARALLRLVDAPGGWTLALDAARARPLLVDALEDLARADSQRVVVRIQRALNTLPDTGAAMEYRGLPVVVRDAWIVHAPQGPLVVARAARLRNLEATAHEELRFIVLDGDQPRYVARVAGDEESVESWELLAALSIQGRPWLAVAREGVGSMQLEFVALHGVTGRSVWRSDALACARTAR